MRRKLLSYRDAAKLLGAQSQVLSAASRLIGTGLAAASAGTDAALGLFDLKSEVERLSQDAVVGLRMKITKLDRFKRSELIEAGHAVLVVSAFFAAMDDLDKELGTTLNAASLELTRAVQVELATEWTDRSGRSGWAGLVQTLTASTRLPGVASGWAKGGGSELLAYYRGLSGRVRGFALGTAAWDDKDETTRDRWLTAIARELPLQAVARYEHELRQLSGEFPEFAFWANRVGVQTILAELLEIRSQHEITLRKLSDLMRPMIRGAAPDMVRADLVNGYRKQVDRPMADVGDIPDGISVPTLREIYVNPSCNKTQPSDLGEVVDFDEWTGESGHDAGTTTDLWSIVMEHLISTDAARAPFVLLGQPGAGKSAFTRMLAADLDPRDFLVVRVELRAVHSDANVYQQVEHAVEHLTRRSSSWRELVDSAGDAQPVVVLDGFDELIQASGVSQADYLEKVQKFQQDEESNNRPVAVLVTSVV